MSHEFVRSDRHPLPWVIGADDCINDGAGRMVGHLRDFGDEGETWETVIKSLNAHDELVAALRDMMAVESEAMSGSRDRGPAMTADTVARFSRARAALAKVDF